MLGPPGRTHPNPTPTRSKFQTLWNLVHATNSINKNKDNNMYIYIYMYTETRPSPSWNEIQRFLIGERRWTGSRNKAKPFLKWNSAFLCIAERRWTGSRNKWTSKKSQQGPVARGEAHHIWIYIYIYLFIRIYICILYVYINIYIFFLKSQL